MTDPDSPADREGADVETGGTDPDRKGANGREPSADADRRATPRLANEPREDDPGESAEGTGDDAGGALDALRDPEPIEPETPQVENVLFVLLGVLGTVALLATAIVPSVF